MWVCINLPNFPICFVWLGCQLCRIFDLCFFIADAIFVLKCVILDYKSVANFGLLQTKKNGTEWYSPTR